MANFRKAPILATKGNKFIDEENQQYYKIPQDIADIVFKEIGTNGAQLRIMMLLIGTREGFGISEAWVLERTGLGHSSYDRARKALITLGWLQSKEGKLIVDYDAIRKTSSNMGGSPSAAESLPEPQVNYQIFDF